MDSHNIASSSVPDLRARQPLFKVLILLGLLGIAGAIVIAVFALKTGDDPGRAACENIDRLSQQDPKPWDRFSKALERTVERRVWNSVDRRYVNIHGDTAYERCYESFGVIRETLAYSKYEKLADCVSKATSYRSGSECFVDY